MKLSSCLERAHYLYVSLTLLIHLIENGKTNEKFSPKKNARNTYRSSYPPLVAIFSTAILTSLPLYTLTLPLITFFFFSQFVSRTHLGCPSKNSPLNGTYGGHTQLPSGSTVVRQSWFIFSGLNSYPVPPFYSSPAWYLCLPFGKIFAIKL